MAGGNFSSTSVVGQRYQCVKVINGGNICQTIKSPKSTLIPLGELGPGDNNIIQPNLSRNRAISYFWMDYYVHRVVKNHTLKK